MENRFCIFLSISSVYELFSVCVLSVGHMYNSHIYCRFECMLWSNDCSVLFCTDGTQNAYCEIVWYCWPWDLFKSCWFICGSSTLFVHVTICPCTIHTKHKACQLTFSTNCAFCCCQTPCSSKLLESSPRWATLVFRTCRHLWSGNDWFLCQRKSSERCARGVWEFAAKAGTTAVPEHYRQYCEDCRCLWEHASEASEGDKSPWRHINQSRISSDHPCREIGNDANSREVQPIIPNGIWSRPKSWQFSSEPNRSQSTNAAIVPGIGYLRSANELLQALCCW